MALRFVDCCVCGNKECFLLQSQMIQQQVLHTTATNPTTTDTASPPSTTTATSATSPSIDPWCQSPYSILFDPQRASYPTWLFVLSVYHHIPEFRQQFLGVVGEEGQPDALYTSISGGTSTESISHAAYLNIVNQQKSEMLHC